MTNPSRTKQRRHMAFLYRINQRRHLADSSLTNQKMRMADPSPHQPEKAHGRDLP